MSSPFGYGQTYIPQYQQSQQSMAPSMAYGGMGNGIQGGPFGFQQKASASPFGMQQQQNPMMNGNPALSQAGPVAVPQGQGALLPVQNSTPFQGLSGFQTDFKGFNPNAQYFSEMKAHIPGAYRERDNSQGPFGDSKESQVAGNKDFTFQNFNASAMPSVDVSKMTFDQAQNLYRDYINNLNYYKNSVNPGQLDQLNQSYFNGPAFDKDQDLRTNANFWNGYSADWGGYKFGDVSNKWVDYYKSALDQTSAYESMAQNNWNNIYNQYAQRGAFGAMG